jgi:hypothetical protein
MMNVFAKGKEVSDSDLQARAVIVNMAQQMGVGQRASQLCPACEGGKSKERSLSLSVEQSGMIKFYCHRSACGFQGTAYTTPGLAPIPSTGLITNSRYNPLTADLHTLSKAEVAWFKTRFNLSNVSEIRRTNARYALPLKAPNGSVRGWITRRPWDGSPADTEANRNDSQWAMKALTYMENDDPVLSWYQASTAKDQDIGTVLVEDPISAMRLIEYLNESDDSYTGKVVALLGTGLNAEKVAEIQRNSRHRVTIALDKDATGQAFAMARKYGQAFSECRVVVLSKDIKDSTDTEIGALPL